MIFNEILAMSAFVKNLAPLLADDLGVLLDDEGNATAQPAMYLADNFAPKSTLPRLVLSYQGSQNGHTINRYAFQTPNPDYQGGEDEEEFLYFIRRENHIEWAMTLTAESGSISEIMTNGRMSANGLLRKVRTLLARESVRKAINADAECGVNFIGNEVASRTLDGVTRTDVSSLLLSNLTYLQQDDEEVVGVIDSVGISGTLSKVDGTDPNPLGVSNGVTDPSSIGTTFAQIGDVIITGSTVLRDSLGNPVADLLLVDGSTFDENVYPELYSILGDSNVLPNIPDETGSPFPYKIVADYTGA